MPCPHFSITITQRSHGQSAVAGAAYQSGEKLYSEYDRKWKFYAKKQGIVYTEIMLPANAPPAFSDRSALWNSVEKIEKQWNSQLARRIVLALPREVTADQFPAMLHDFCREHFVSKGMCADFAIHDKGDGNPHAHIMLTMRAMDERGKWLPKSRKVYDLDENGNRIRLPSGYWKSHKEDTVDWNEQSKAELWRHSWEVLTNRYLEQNGRPERVDLRSFERQGIDLAPTVHLGPAATQMEKRGIQTDLGNLNREIRCINRALLAIRKLISDLKSKIADLKEKWEQLNKEKPQEPMLAELLLQYMDARREERTDWSSYAQINGSLKDLKKISHALVCLQEQKIKTVEDLHERLSEKQAEADKIRNQIRGKEKRMRDIQALLKACDSASHLAPLHQEYKAIGWKKKQESFYQKNKAELDEYNKSLRLIIKFYPDKKVPAKDLREELKELTAEVAALRPKAESIKAELDDLKIIRYSVNYVQKESETSAENDVPKEKESVIERLHEKQEIINERDRQKRQGKTQSPQK